MESTIQRSQESKGNIAKMQYFLIALQMLQYRNLQLLFYCHFPMDFKTSCNDNWKTRLVEKHSKVSARSCAAFQIRKYVKTFGGAVTGFIV